MKIKANVLIERRKKDGIVIERIRKHNLAVNDGKERVAKLLGGLSSTTFGYIAIGTGTTSPTVNDSALETETVRASATKSYEASNKMVFEKTFEFSSGESYAITEAGIFDSATESGSTMLNRVTFSAKNVDVDIDIYVKITITVS